MRAEKRSESNRLLFPSRPGEQGPRTDCFKTGAFLQSMPELSLYVQYKTVISVSGAVAALPNFSCFLAVLLVPPFVHFSRTRSHFKVLQGWALGFL